MEIENVRRGLECLTQMTSCMGCPYWNSGRTREECLLHIGKDTLALLKEQEGIISALKSDLKETLEVLSGQLNVVHCKDCCYCDEDTMECKNRMGRFPVKADWFCADAWKRDSYDGTWQAI